MLSGICYINLDKRTDRRQRLEQSIAASDLSGIPLHRVPAYNSVENDFTYLLGSEAVAELQDLQNTGVRHHHAQLSAGAIGCYLSHYETWKKISELPVPDNALFLILEDDADVPAHAQRKIKKGIEALEASGVDLGC